MLNSLFINNFALVEQLTLSFNDGLTTITGETGAGKSIIIDALQYALGARADASVVRQGAEQATIVAVFNITKTPAAGAWLSLNALSTHDVHATTCELRRTITHDGRSKQFINQHAVTQGQLRQLAEQLISIHGQHENQSLLKRDAQLQFLDDFTCACYPSFASNAPLSERPDHAELLKKVHYYYEEWVSLNREIRQLAEQDSNPARIELLRYQLEELNELALQPNEVSALNAEYKRLSNTEDQVANCRQALDLLYQTEHYNAFGLLTTAVATIGNDKHVDKSIESAYNLLNDAMVNVQEATHNLRDYVEHIEANPQRLQEIDARLNGINAIARKHRISPTRLDDLHEQLRDEFDKATHREQRLAILQDDCLRIEKTYHHSAQQLRSNREEASKLLNTLVSKYIQRLGINEGLFAVALTKEANIRSNGIDSVDFLVCTNPGQPFKPLNKVVSGGELSRISLAIQVITTKAENQPCLIFDEVDVGVGGRLAEIIGEFLVDLAQRTQILCITHLPQVAAQGQYHLQVTKSSDAQQTYVTILPLTGEARVEEIARMLGGVNITAQTRAHAREMLQSNTTV